MMRKVNTVFSASIMLGLLSTAAARGQDNATAALLDATHAMQAHLQVEQWLAEGVIPPPELVPPVLVRGLRGVCVTLRTDGLTVGEGDVLTPGGASEEPTDLSSLLRQATKKAFDGLEQSLRDAELRAVVAGRDATTPVQPTIKDIAPRVKADVQLAYALEPVRIAPDAPQDQVFDRFAPGFHGLRLTDADSGNSAVTWPATALGQNVSPNSQLVQLLGRLQRPPQDIARIGRPKGAALERFAVHHVATPNVAAPPLLLVRGNVPLPPRTIDAVTLDKMAVSLADHLSQRFTIDGELRGTYHPTSGRYDPLIADPDEAMLTAYALTRYVRRERTIRPDDGMLVALNRKAQDLALRLTTAMTEGRLEATPGLAALALLTVVDNSVPPRRTDLRDHMTDLLLELRSADGAFRAGRTGEAREANQTVSALATAALAAAYDQTRRDDLAEPVRVSMDRLWAQTRGNVNINALPWLALAHERTGELLAGDEQHLAVKAQRDAALARLVNQMVLHQVVDSPRIGPEDVVGGFELRPSPPDTPPNPNWTTAQLLMFLSTATRQPQLRQDQDQLGWLLSAGLAARFLRQLQVHSVQCYYIRSPAEAIGGVRLALWNNQQPLRASAMALLAVVDLQQTLAEFD